MSSTDYEIYIIIVSGLFTLLNTVIACMLHMRIKSACMTCEPVAKNRSHSGSQSDD